MGREFNYYKTRITISVLSEEPYDPVDLDQVAYDITSGDCVGGEMTVEGNTLSGKEVADLLYEFGSEPGFFNLDDEGKIV